MANIQNYVDNSNIEVLLFDMDEKYFFTGIINHYIIKVTNSYYFANDYIASFLGIIHIEMNMYYWGDRNGQG